MIDKIEEIEDGLQKVCKIMIAEKMSRFEFTDSICNAEIKIKGLVKDEKKM